jgi:hypothetical protein
VDPSGHGFKWGSGIARGPGAMAWDCIGQVGEEEGGSGNPEWIQ